jgi:uncharacterized protein
MVPEPFVGWPFCGGACGSVVLGKSSGSVVTEFTNRLIHEKSPYLQQHAHNPVDWYPWGEEAFAKAKELERPIFLSIGYATCHWCHVMEKESFANAEIGKLLNEAFINIKVDREEHPEVDSLYMDLAQAMMTGGGGWPLNVILAPDLKPLLAVTYLPPVPTKELISFPEFISQVKQLWEGPERKILLFQSEKLIEMVGQSTNATGHEIPLEETLTQAVEKFFSLTDPINGGLRGAPKFPLGFQSEFLLGWSKLKSDSRALFYAELTLDMMQRGGIYDHLGGGFARYAVDEEWTIPHFEKMLYDNAILAKAYLQAWKYTQNPSFRDVTQKTLDYLMRVLQHKEGGFFSGEDADSRGSEGLYYTWTPHEVHELLSGEDGELFCAFYDVTGHGNFEGRNVLHIDLPLEEFAAALQMPKEDVEKVLEKGRKALFQEREKREKPLCDEKILVSWNGLAIDVLARAGEAFQEPRYTEAAVKAAAFIEKNLWQNGHLLHRWCGGEAKFPALLDDYAFLIKGLLSLFEVGLGASYFEWAVKLAKIVERDFKEIEGAFYLTDEKTPLLIRPCDFYDGAEPSGNAVHSENLLRLYQMTQDENYLRQAEDIIKAAKRYLDHVAPAACYHMMALLRYLDQGAPHVVIVPNQRQEGANEIRQALGKTFSPHLVTLWKMGEEFPLEKDKMAVSGQTTAYFCRQKRCEAPLTKLEEIVKAVEKG